ncbi:hypothetical protein [Jiangella alba]|uniref:Uncharacterized protein n=1 Tax=Jiangella alba TaxID=561176 RepID=A0A1H5MXV4_9ACTN|nr:hypothetical protein [Jiangella alba]SEE94192.1 hypothetical protein SAMN04488561_3530 [Jiangella alba]
MGLIGARESHAVTGDLHLWVRYDGEETLPVGDARTRFRWTAESVDGNTRGWSASGPMYGPPGTKVTSADALQAIAWSLAKAAEGEGPGVGMLGDYPDWLIEIARRNVEELHATVAATGSVAAAERETANDLDGPEADLLAVEVAREVLRRAHDILAADIGRAEDIAVAHDVAERANPEVVIAHPDDPFDLPLYEGRAAEAHLRLGPGVYPARDKQDVSEMVVVVGTSPFSDTGLASAAFPALSQASPPRRARFMPMGQSTNGADRPDPGIDR